MAGRGGVEKNNLGKLMWDGGINLNKTIGIGQGMSFAYQLRAKVGPKVNVVGLVLCARGGSLIGQWRKNPCNPNATSYQNFIERIKALDKNGIVVHSLFWFQGESDATMNDTAIRYKYNLKKFFANVRNDIKPRFLPIIVVKIAIYDFIMKHDTNNLPTVSAAEDAFSKELPNVL
ncbi:unnamed protein product [Citrullus colocynthis]|uniref:Sialate O-acetylesterase domain-containing protein n=1 Tax=Citrullus colocynthis TaxID=252529 RepID=A0ABP0XWL2_9ROSI